MYKCTECGCEFDIKPDFCDCGNDEFVITVETVEEKVKEEKIEKEPEVIKPQPAKPNYKNIKKEAKKTFAERYPSLSRFFNSFEPISFGIFIFCIILSIVIISIKVENSEDITVDEPHNIIEKEIPNIDKFWNNKVAETKTEKSELQKSIQTVAPAVNIPKPIKKTVTAPKTTTVKLTKAPKKQTQSVIKQKQVTKPVQIQQHKPVNSSQKTTVQNVSSQVQPAKQTTQSVTQPQVQQPVKQEPDYAKLQAELNNYKASLRNTIGRKIDFTRVVGDGSCIVSFKINSEGRLTNRSFSKQSSNITLNDAVYSAIMSTPTFNPPPAGYKNETLNLSIKFYNGNFEISLK